MDPLIQVLFIGGTLMFVGILLGAYSTRFGVPFLLVFLVVGMLAGEDGPGKIEFSDYRLAFIVGNLALAIILLDGGVRTRLDTFRVALGPSLALATLGVVLTAGAVGTFAAWAIELPWPQALLLGAIVGSTDAAAVFALLKSGGTRLSHRVAYTLEIESGVNDPMAIFLTIVLIELIVQSESRSGASLALELAQQFGVGVVIGVGLGYVLERILRTVPLNDGLHALLLCSGGVTVFSVASIVGGSGFLAAYIVGLIVGNGPGRKGEGVLQALDGMAWLAQSGMFLLLGLLVTPHRLVGNIGSAFAVALFLIFAARPLAVWVTLLPFRFRWREMLFIGWVGLRGAVPIVLAIFPLLAGVPEAGRLFDAAFIVVLCSLLLQGTTIAPAARALHVNLPSRAEPTARARVETPALHRLEIVQFVIGPDSNVAGSAAAGIELTPDVHLLGVVQEGRVQTPAGAQLLRPGDVVLLVAPESAVERLGDLFGAESGPRPEGAFYGDFTLDGHAAFEDVAALYGAAVPEDLVSLTLDAALRSKLRSPVEGDVIDLAGLRFTVRSMAGGRIDKVGIRLPRSRGPAT